MSSNVLGSLNAALLAQCRVMPPPPDAAELPVHITEYGAAGSSVFFVHGGVQGGIGGGPANWKGQLALADRGWRLRLIDRPGFGASPSRGPDDMIADAALIAERLEPGDHLIGHSFGGAEALLAAASRPQTVRSLILVEPALQMMLSTDPQSLADPHNKDATDIVVKHLLSAKTPAEYAIGFVGALGKSSEAEDNMVVAGLKADPDRAMAMGCALLSARMAKPEVVRAAADEVAAAKIPVMVVTGGYSSGQEALGKAVARLTGGRHVVVAAPSHFLQQDCPEAFNETIDAFLKEAEILHGSVR